MNKRIRRKIWKSCRIRDYPDGAFLKKLYREFGSPWDKWALSLRSGDKVEDCSYRVVTVKEITLHGPSIDFIDEERGFSHNVKSCCEPILCWRYFGCP